MLTLSLGGHTDIGSGCDGGSTRAFGRHPSDGCAGGTCPGDGGASASGRCLVVGEHWW